MKKLLHITLFVLFGFSIVISRVSGQSQTIHETGGYKIITGERPPVDFHQLSSKNWEPGIFIVKFNEEQVKNLDDASFTNGKDGALVTGIEAFDLLSIQFKVTAGQSVLSGLYQVPGKHNDFKERHKAWGFHQWFVFTMEYEGDLLQLIDAYKGLESVELVEPQLKIRRIEPVGRQPIPKDGGQNSPKWTPDDVFYNLQWNLENTGQTVFGMPGTPGSDVNVKPAWDITKGLPDVVVAIFDGGIKYDHVDLAGNRWPEIGPDGIFTVADDHATSVAGIISAVSNNGAGVAGIAGGSGLGNGARLMSLDIYAGLHGLSTMELYMYAADNGAAISQNSWGYVDPDVYNTDDLYGIDYFNANGGGDVMDGGITFFAAGNDGDGQNWYPGYYSGTVAVAGTDNNDRRAYFSSYGAYVGLSAPGLNVPSTGIATGGADGYFYNSGTSFSSPHASGVAALMLAMAPGKLSPQQLREIMKATADDIDYLNPDVAGQIGVGRINAVAALQG
ncbi:MAG: S8 family serine peptidase, partial [Bacteroidales bacterium]|nr:S8 family serine peptidase [Bacteroidales bacterium]